MVVGRQIEEKQNKTKTNNNNNKKTAEEVYGKVQKFCFAHIEMEVLCANFVYILSRERFIRISHKINIEVGL